MSLTLKLAYAYGQTDALDKLAVRLSDSAGTIPYKVQSEQLGENFDFRADEQEELWDEIDRTDITTGEESSLGMPSPGKTAGLQDGGFGSHEGSYAQGGMDETQDMPPDKKERIISSDIEQAFLSNEEYDKSYAPEPPITQPHGGADVSKQAFDNFDPTKIAAPASTMGLGASLKPPNPMSQNTQNISNPNNSPQKLNQKDPNQDLPMSAKLQQGITDNVNRANINASVNSPQQRLSGNVV